MAKDFETLLAKASRTNAKRDAIDRKAGFGAPGDPVVRDGVDLTLLMLLRTAMSAIESGMSGVSRGGLTDGDLGCVAEGFAMLEQLHAAIDPQHRPYR